MWYGNIMQVLPCVILNHRMKQISHTACILSTPFVQHHLHHYCHHHFHHQQHWVFYSLIIRPWAVCNTPMPTPSEAKSTATAPGDARSTATNEASLTPTCKAGDTVTRMLPVKAQCWRGKSEHVRAVRRSLSVLLEVGEFQSFLPAYSISIFCATTKAISNATSLLPANPDPLLLACS